LRGGTSRKLVFTYKPDNEPRSQNIEMKFSKNHNPKLWKDESNYADFLAALCRTLNEDLARVVDNAEFHIVEVKIIK